jgi:hypothetical protein
MVAYAENYTVSLVRYAGGAAFAESFGVPGEDGRFLALSGQANICSIVFFFPAFQIQSC